MKNEAFREFFKWLKRNNIYHLFVFNTKHYPDEGYSLEEWLQEDDWMLMNKAPFDFNHSIVRKTIKKITKDKDWYNMIVSWRIYLNNKRNKNE